LFNETVPQRHMREVMNDDTQSCVSDGFERASPRNFGQLYNGRVLTGILWLIITPGLFVD
jgi:hypothetical protein